MNRSILDNDYADFNIIGIVSYMPLSTFLYYAEQSIEVSFKLNINKCKEKKSIDGETYFFELYEYYDWLRYFTHYLYINEQNGQYLLPEAKNVQWLWGIKGLGLGIDKNEYIEKIIISLRRHVQVQYAMLIKHEKIISKEILLF